MITPIVRTLTSWLPVMALSHPILLFAQAAPPPSPPPSPPDGGMLRQQIERSLPPLVPPPKAAEPKPLPPPPLKSLPGAVLVREFRFTGNTLIPTATLEATVSSWRGLTLSFNQLQEAVSAVAETYRIAGWVVRVYLPQQEIAEGAVTIHIVEAAFGGVRFEAENVARIDLKRLEKILEKNQTPGQPIHADALDRALLLMSELPGVSVAGSLREGKRHGESEVVLKVADSQLFSGDASLDNTGSRSTGKEKAAANLYLNSPLKLTDRLGFNLSHTRGSDYIRAAYSAPLGYGGWRAGINTSHMRYKLVTPEFQALNVHGDSDVSGVDLSYPMIRSLLANLLFAFTADYKSFNNLSGGQTTTRYKMAVWSAGMNGNLTDKFASGGTSSASVTLSGGDVDLDGSPNRVADAATTRTAGNFSKLRYVVSRLQTITSDLSFSAALSGQLASKNLDSGEKFYLGGSAGVRAYPSNEGGGSEGNMVNLELRWLLQPQLSIVGLYDWGRVKVNRRNDFAGSAVRNNYSLQGAGIALAWADKGGRNIKAVWARRIGNNPNPTATGNDQDGSLVCNRFWLTASLTF